jgi:hypothetical protein
MNCKFELLIGQAIASRLIKEAVVNGLVRLQDPAAAQKLRSYLPYWA